MPYTDVDVDITVSKVISYDDMGNKPTINDVVLEGNLTSENLKLQPAGDYVTSEKQEEDLNKKQNTLVAGQNITIDNTDPDNPVISASNEIDTVTYDNVTNKPLINNVELKNGNNTLESLGIQPTGDYATKQELRNVASDISNVSDDLQSVVNHVDNQGQSLNELNTAITNLSNSKADRDELDNYISNTGGDINGSLVVRDSIGLVSTSGQNSTSLIMSEDGLLHISSGIYVDSNSQSEKGKILFSQDRGGANGVASLDSNSKIPFSQININSILSNINGYDSSKTQILKNINGRFMWVEE